MTHLRILIKSSYLSVAMGLLASIVLPLSLLASATSPTCTPATPPAETGNGVHHPIGTDASLYVYCTSGLWQSPHFTFDPASGLTAPTDPPLYKYNAGTGNYDIYNWIFNAPSGNYIPYTNSSVANPPAGAVVEGAPAPKVAATSPTSLGGSATNATTNGASAGSLISSTGPGSNNTNNLTGNNNLNANNLTNATVTNNLTGLAGSGNSFVTNNTYGGSAGTGNAQDMATIINQLQSTSNAFGPGSNVITFTDNINGDVNGDLLLNPAALGSSIQGTGPGSNNTGNTNLDNNLTINNSANTSINNDISVGANSGDATVSSNTYGGDATTGSAKAIANVVNMINSALTAGKSFIGTININGNLNGDILLPPNFIDQLIADNVPTVSITGPGSNNTSNTNTSNNTNITNTNNQGITNTVNAGANSGAANVSNNTTGGNATSGTANTHITAFNLTGSKVIGANAILVFVNVTGQWIGLIVNAPAGATAAELGGGITSTGPNSNNTNNTDVNNDATVNNTANQQINNKITTAAKSGAANVSNNTHGGNATSGNADSAVNLLNVENSTLDLSNWFGTPAPKVAATSPTSLGGSATNATTNGASAGSLISSTGPGSNNTNNLTGNNNLNANNLTNATVTNNLTGLAGSGNSFVTNNTYGGSAGTGNAQDMATIINQLQSTSNAFGPGSNVITFTDNINGDVNGDLLLNPAALGSSIQGTGPGSNNTGNTNLDNNLTINNSANTSINNDISVGANSGDATVSSNTYGGDATTGSAKAIANVVNMINSALTAGKSFIGTININGNLNGDILLPPNFIDQLIADNVPTVSITGPGSNNTSNTNTSNNTNITNTNNQGITNTVNAGANSGAANVSNNTTGGNATSGTANTHITAFNLTGSKVIGANAILVFVNVTGQWIGLIVNAPAGATAAELGGGITSTGPNSNNTNNTDVNNDATVNNTANQQINNKITTAAKSGAANVSNNTHGGNATSGNADSAVNLLNVENSTLDLSNWFGILFINVFGTWHGSFGINTSAGDPIAASVPGVASIGPVFSFVPNNGVSKSNASPAAVTGHGFTLVHGISPTSSSSANEPTDTNGTFASIGNGAVLASSTLKSHNNSTASKVTPTHLNWIVMVGISLAFGGTYLIGERLISNRHNRKLVRK